MCVHLLSGVQLFATPWSVALQTLLSMELSRKEYWNRLPFPSPEHFPSPGTEPASPVSLAWVSRFFTTVPPGKPNFYKGFY